MLYFVDKIRLNEELRAKCADLVPRLKAQIYRDNLNYDSIRMFMLPSERKLVEPIIEEHKAKFLELFDEEV